jgi:hypothetical protein
MPFNLILSILSSNKMLLVALILAVISTIVGYHFITVGHLRANVSSLTLENTNLKSSITALSEQLESVKENNRLVLQELANLRRSDAEARSQLTNAVTALRSAEARAARLASRTNDPNTFINNTNNQMRCIVENFFNPSVDCILGSTTTVNRRQ